MGHGALVAIALTMSVATGGAVVGTAVLVSGTTSASASAPSAASARAAASPAKAASATAAATSASSRSGAIAGAQAIPPTGPTNPTAALTDNPGTADPQPTASASAPASSGAAPLTAAGWVPQAAPAKAAPAKPFDVTAAIAGFAGPYRFVAHLDGLAGMTDLGGVVQGSVIDATHFTLDFPESTFVTRYVRHGTTARAVVGGRTVTAQPGVETAGAISPEDMLPSGIWLQVIAPWEATLLPDGPAGGYAASGTTLTNAAAEHGYPATNWRLSATTDATERLTTLAFSGISSGEAFSLDLVVLYG